MPIVTNQLAREKRIQVAIDLAVSVCQEAADRGLSSVFFTTDRDIQREVRDILEEQHKIYVPIKYSKDSPSRTMVDHWRDRTEMKLQWN
jgi:predicted transcriptional regulator